MFVEKNMLTNYYDYLGLENLCEIDEGFLAKFDRIFDELTENENLISVASKMETGVYLLTIPDLKESYDYLLEKGSTAILTDTFEYVYVLSVIVYKRVVTTLHYFFAFNLY
jgi:vacuolar-type H+-ATPase subunit C/Vma6